VRGAVGVSDRGHTAASQLAPGDVDWEDLFGRRGVRWFHTGGIFAALGAETADLVAEAATVARRHGTVVSYDLNFRPSLWLAHGGEERAWAVNRRIVGLVDVLFGNEEDFTAALGFTVAGVDSDLRTLPVPRFAAMIQEVVDTFPGLRLVASTLRGVRSASRNDWGAIAWADGQVHEAVQRPDLEVLDRVGGGDSFASGLVYGLLQGHQPALALEYGAAHGALAMTTPGDTSMASLAEVEHLMAGGGARIAR
jgi:2-dehydro-3-deoxygluconokinase